jgi:TfoX/Sxy family transcriptional regulator of competence genes
MPPTFEKSPPELVKRFEELAELVPEATKRQMFGYPTCVLDGNMFMGLHEDRFILRLGPEDRAALTKKGGTPFEPMPGRPMKEYLVVPAALVKTKRVEPWIARSLEFAHTLPPKAAKAKKAKKAGKVKRP